ncbi:MAG: lanthionine synthetase LanC family protein [Jatrophihabitantaceae bacterium]
MVPAAGLAHGRAGTVLLLARLAAADPDAKYAGIARKKATELAAEASVLAVLAGRLTARPLAVSWCQGLAGIALALNEAGVLLAEPDLVRVAVGLTDHCLAWVPRLSTVGQCCGLAGVGSMLIELAPARSRFGAAGHPDGGGSEVAGQLLRRSAGPATEPVFQRAGQRPDLSFSTGSAGLLAFFRELRDAGQQPATATARRR